MARKGLGKGLDSLIPNFYDEDFDSNSTQSLEDMLNDVSEEEPTEEVEVQEEETVEVEIEDEGSDDEEEETGEGDGSSEDLSSDSDSEEAVQTSQEIEIQEEHVDEVKQIVEKNPRITLWSSRSSAVFRYLRKTEPEFSISKEASVLIEDAVAKKYPEIWALFEDL